VTRLRHEATFVFSGTVQRAESSGLSFIPSSPSTAVVRVERIYHASPDLHAEAGQEVTVLYMEGSTPASGDRRRVFFTDPVAFGETIAVREIGSMDEPDDPEAIAGLVARGTAEMEEEQIREHLASADAVVQGRVAETHPASRTPERYSEHDPEWWVARIEVMRSFKGDLEGDVSVRYPNSRDVRWYAVPKPEEGQEAIFVLHRDGLRRGEAALAVLHQNDVVEPEAGELDRHGRLV